MLHKYNYLKCLYLLPILALLFSCSKNENQSQEIFEPNVDKRARAAVEGGGITIFGNKPSGSTTYEFASSNILWRVTLKSLDFLPLINADYSGGVIIYDWYSQSNNPKEQIKISVQFLNNELRSDSIKITAHKKICETAERCSNSTLDQNFANSIKENIIASARTLKIEETKKEKK
jgi:hypothetical protein